MRTLLFLQAVPVPSGDTILGSFSLWIKEFKGNKYLKVNQSQVYLKKTMLVECKRKPPSR